MPNSSAGWQATPDVWNQWVRASYKFTATTSATTANVYVNNIWDTWASGTTASATVNFYTDTIENTASVIWNQWQTDGLTIRYVQSAEQQKAEEERKKHAAIQAVNAEFDMERENAVRRVNRLFVQEYAAEAERRAKALLMELLTPEQNVQYETLGHFDVEVVDPRDGRERLFRIKHGTTGNVSEISRRNRQSVLARYCIHHYGRDDHGREPTEDTMAHQLLMLQSELPEFERIANITRVTRAMVAP